MKQNPSFGSNLSSHPGLLFVLLPRSAALLCLVLLVLACMPGLAKERAMLPENIVGQTPPEGQDDPLLAEMTVEAVRKRLAGAEARLAEVETEPPASQWKRVRDLLLLELKQLKQLESPEAAFAAEEIVLPTNTPPFPLSFLDEVRGKQRRFEAKESELDEAHEAAVKRIDLAEAAFEDATRKLHDLDDSAAPASDHEAADLALQLAKENLIEARLEARIVNAEIKVNRENLDAFTERLPAIADNVVFSSDQDFDVHLAEIGEREEVLKAALAETKRELGRERLKPAEEQTGRKSLERIADLLNHALTNLPRERAVLEERRTLHSQRMPMRQIAEWAEKNSRAIDEVGEFLRVKELRDANGDKDAPTGSQAAELEGKVPPDLENDLLLREKFAFDSLAALSELLKNHQADLDQAVGSQQVSFFKERALSDFHAIWGLELAVVKDRPITLGKVVTAISVFLVGMILSRLLITGLLQTVLKRLRIRDGVAFTVAHLLHYVALAILFLFAISYVDIPLTIFAFFGGALAIAAGFGSQKILNNFLSGVILLLEGSIRVGDMVEVQETVGRVQRIGTRHVQITTFANVDILVPNSHFLEGKVVNWTLRSTLVRCDFEVAVDMDAPIGRVTETLVQSLRAHTKVEKDPAPEAYLAQINSDAGYLSFQLYFWMHMNTPMERVSVESDLRRAVIEALRTQGIELASPTQDLILHRGGAVDEQRSWGRKTGRLEVSTKTTGVRRKHSDLS